MLVSKPNAVMMAISLWPHVFQLPAGLGAAALLAFCRLFLFDFRDK